MQNASMKNKIIFLPKYGLLIALILKETQWYHDNSSLLETAGGGEGKTQ